MRVVLSQHADSQILCPQAATPKQIVCQRLPSVLISPVVASALEPLHYEMCFDDDRSDGILRLYASLASSNSSVQFWKI